MSGDKVWIANDLWGSDAIAGATPMGELATGAHPSASALDMLIGTIPGSTCETSFIAIALGAILLLMTGIASWRIMLSVFLGGGVMGLLFNAIGYNDYMQLPFYYHFLMGAFAVLLRVCNPAYPEGMMLSILFMNCMAPLIDHCVVAANIKRRERRTAK
jgi:Na+-transporting NADH:ubiquinone oxidoreductase subunit B